MRIGVPREIKDGESRVALTPAAVAQLRDVVIEPGAGAAVGFPDAQYVAAGASLGNAWDCELVVKVKELQEAEYHKPRRGQIVCGFQQFTAEPKLLEGGAPSALEIYLSAVAAKIEQVDPLREAILGFAPQLVINSARSKSDCDIVMPSALAAFILMTSLNFVGCSIGKSPGLAPLRILST